MRIRRAYLLLVLVALLVASRASASAIFISLDDNGHEFTLDRGDALVISLPATSGTGYTWQAQPVAGGFVKQVGDPTFERDSTMPGASGHQVFHFGIGGSGTGTLEMHYLRPWEKDKPPAKVFKVTLTVQ
jgi:inhibitor of cysteine peptidase